MCQLILSWQKNSYFLSNNSFKFPSPTHSTHFLSTNSFKFPSPTHSTHSFCCYQLIQLIQENELFLPTQNELIQPWFRPAEAAEEIGPEQRPGRREFVIKFTCPSCELSNLMPHCGNLSCCTPDLGILNKLKYMDSEYTLTACRVYISHTALIDTNAMISLHFALCM